MECTWTIRCQCCSSVALVVAMNMSRLLVTLFVTGGMTHQSLIRSASDPSAACHALNDAYPAQVLFPSARNYTVEADGTWKILTKKR